LATCDSFDIIPGVVDCFQVKAIHHTEQEKVVSRQENMQSFHPGNFRAMTTTEGFLLRSTLYFLLSTNPICSVTGA